MIIDDSLTPLNLRASRCPGSDQMADGLDAGNDAVERPHLSLRSFWTLNKYTQLSGTPYGNQPFGKFNPSNAQVRSEAPRRLR